MRKSDNDRNAWRLEERRKESRFNFVLRVGLLEQQGKSSFCLVKNMSRSGIQFKFYARPIPDAESSIRIADEPPIKGRIVWIEAEVAGMRFDGELDTATLLCAQQKLRPNRRRSTPRVSVDASATLRSGGRICRATVCDISSQGARIRTPSGLTEGDRALISFADLPSLKAFVRWSDGEESGLVFETPIPMQIIAHWIQAARGPECLGSSQ